MTTSPTSITPDAGTAAAVEAAAWMVLARTWHPGRQRPAIIDVPPAEAAVVAFYNPIDDLARRARSWSYQVGAGDFADLARFGAALARAESEAWASDRGHIATRAYEDRRFLLGDRVIHWAVPWFDAVARQYPTSFDAAIDARNRLLDLADHHRPAPALSGSEGLVVPGFDGFGSLDVNVPFEQFMLSVWSGVVLLDGFLADLFKQPIKQRTLPGDWDSYPGVLPALEATYRAAAVRWDDLAQARQGSAQLWRDLANRARRTADKLHRWKPYRDISDDTTW
ncbi:MAG: hypothetical protein OEX97_03895 [Acidimicrobiia bacterium]|nr:hypothetical protein [Acidimicrobiia bacterium]